MSYVWGVRGTAKRTPLTDALRQELYVAPYDSIDWDAARNQCAKPDLYYPHPRLQVWDRCLWSADSALTEVRAVHGGAVIAAPGVGRDDCSLSDWVAGLIPCG
jgi:hypothetical protein